MLSGKKAAITAALCCVGMVVAACGSSTDSGDTADTGTSVTQTDTGGDTGGDTESPSDSDQGTDTGETDSSDTGGSDAGVEVGADDITTDFAAMEKLKDVAAAGEGKITAILPDTTTSARYTEFDAPYLEKSFQMAGLSDSDYSVVNAQGSTDTQLTLAQNAISDGASVLIVDPLDSGTGAQIESYAAEHGVPVIDYDRLVLGGQREYYVSFDNVKVGELIGDGFVQCATDWGLDTVTFIEMAGDPTDNNASMFKEGYDSVVDPLVADGSYNRVAEPAGTWNPQEAATLFQQAMTANPDVNAAITPNDGNTAPIITYLKTLNVEPNTFPLTGQDATLEGLQNILAGYQCGTVYKPIYLEAQAAAALAIYLRAGQTPPDSLVNGTAKDTEAGTDVAAVLMTPIWVTADNMNDTVVKDGAVTADQLCKGYEDACEAAGISG